MQNGQIYETKKDGALKGRRYIGKRKEKDWDHVKSALLVNGGEKILEGGAVLSGSDQGGFFVAVGVDLEEVFGRAGGVVAKRRAAALQKGRGRKSAGDGRDDEVGEQRKRDSSRKGRAMAQRSSHPFGMTCGEGNKMASWTRRYKCVAESTEPAGMPALP
jgi:hypothetical protein